MAQLDLYEILKRRQDELRGRPLDWRDHLQSWFARQDWSYLVGQTCFIVAGLLWVFVAIARVVILLNS